MTAFYMFRLFIKTFLGQPRNHHAHEHAHESPWTMTAPLLVLAALSVVGGGFLGESSKWFERRISSQSMAFRPLPEAALAAEPFARVGGEEALHHAHGPVMAMSLAAFLAGLAGALLFFWPSWPLARRELIKPGTLLGGLHRAVLNLWYVDRVLTAVFISLVHVLRRVCAFFDQYVVDSLVNLQAYLCRFAAWVVGLADYWGVDGTVRGIGEATLEGGKRIRRLQSGRLPQYVYASFFLFAGVLAASFWLMWASKK
jgi:NADH-quinone oxidoreductase subunit L